MNYINFIKYLIMKITLDLKVLSSNKPPYSDNLEVITINIKQEQSIHEIKYNTITCFIDRLFNMLSEYNLNIDIHADKYELVVAGQYDNVNGWEPELAPALEPSEKTLLEYFGDDIYYLSFYLRPILSPQN